MGMAESVDELRKVFTDVGGVPWNHTMATDRHGDVLYADTTLVPNFTDEGEAAFRELVEGTEVSFTKLAFSAGVVAVDGSDPLFSIDEDAAATLAGAIPFSEAPKLVGRRDFVLNANDSYWLSNPEEPLSGYSLRYGNSETPRSLRTRMGLTQIGESDNWDLDELQDLLFANRSYTETLWRDSFTDRCAGVEEINGSDGNPVNVEAACMTLLNWDGRYNVQSMGAILFRELMTDVTRNGLIGGQDYFTEGFDLDNPVDTPRGLNDAEKERLLTSLADAVSRLQQVGIPIDASLGDHQFGLQGTERFALHGGNVTSDGAFNAMIYTTNLNTSLLERVERAPVVNDATDLTEEGYKLNYGASFIMALEFTDDGPEAEAILIYSQSDDPDSEHYDDQMSLFSEQTWRPLPYSREQIEEDPKLTSTEISQ
jgi:acyl-homoserine-lactone acylase